MIAIRAGRFRQPSVLPGCGLSLGVTVVALSLVVLIPLAALMLRAASIFGMEGYLAMLVGQKVPYRAGHQPSPGHWQRWQRHRAECAAIAKNGVTVKEALDRIRRADWQWS